MSDPKRSTLITVGAPKSAKNNVTKTVRLTINLDESNESKYPELNYKELVIAEENKKKIENGKTAGLDPFSDNDDDVERVAKKFEQKYGGNSTYGRKGRSKTDDFADIGAGYDENDSFIDNTDGYDEVMPLECDTVLGGFYINCGMLEFKNVQNHQPASDGEHGPNRRNKRPISYSSSDAECSDSSSGGDSTDDKEPRVTNGQLDSHNTEHRKKKNKKTEKNKAKKIRRTDSSAATSGKQTSDDNGQGEGESGDSRTSQSDSLTSKPAPSSENAITSDSSRDVEPKEVKLSPQVEGILDDLRAAADAARQDQHLLRLQRALSGGGGAGGGVEARACRRAWSRAARSLATDHERLTQRVNALLTNGTIKASVTSSPAVPGAPAAPAAPQPANNKRKSTPNTDNMDFSQLTPHQRELQIEETLARLKQLIDERTPDMMANYNAECKRVQEERKKILMATSVGAPHVDKRLPKRRFPWCGASRALLARLTALAPRERAHTLLAARALPLFPPGFVRMPTLLRQADLNKQNKGPEVRRPKLPAVQMPAVLPTPSLPETIQFPSSLTVTTTLKEPEKLELAIGTNDKHKTTNTSKYTGLSLNLGPELTVEKHEERKKQEKKEDVYIPPNNIGSITITPVPTNQKIEKKQINSTSSKDNKKEALIRVKSPAALNEMVKKDKPKKVDKPVQNSSERKEKRVMSPLHIDTNYQLKKEHTPSPKNKAEEISKKHIETMRCSENNIPRPALVPVHNSPTFAKPDKRPPEVKKKKDLVIVSDMDPLGDITDGPVPLDDSSSDVEVIEDTKTDRSEVKSDQSDSVPCKDKVREVDHTDKVKSDAKEPGKPDDSQDDFDAIMRNLREMENSQDTTKVNSSYGGVIMSAKHDKSSNARGALVGEHRSNKDKFSTNLFEPNRWM